MASYIPLVHRSPCWNSVFESPTSDALHSTAASTFIAPAITVETPLHNVLSQPDPLRMFDKIHRKAWTEDERTRVEKGFLLTNLDELESKVMVISEVRNAYLIDSSYNDR